MVSMPSCTITSTSFRWRPGSASQARPGTKWSNAAQQRGLDHARDRHAALGQPLATTAYQMLICVVLCMTPLVALRPRRAPGA
jgi:hypothetical protein